MPEQLELFPRHNPRAPALGLVSRAPRRGVHVGMKVTVLQSGSAGNATLVQAGNTNILIDCGLNPKTLSPRLATCGLHPGDISAVMVTHEHGDHIGGCGALASRFAVPLYMTQGTYEASDRTLRRRDAKDRVRILPMRGWIAFRDGEPVDDDPDSVDLSVDWVPVSHDGKDTVAYAAQRKSVRFGVLTDLGIATPAAERMLASLDAVSLETNHDPKLLQMSSYPPFVIRRILGPGGHLSNEQAAQLLSKAAEKRLHTILLAHISQRANTAELALETIRAVAGDRRLMLTNYDAPCESIEL